MFVILLLIAVSFYLMFVILHNMNVIIILKNVILQIQISSLQEALSIKQKAKFNLHISGGSVNLKKVWQNKRRVIIPAL